VIKFRQLMQATKMLRAGQFGDGAILKANAFGAGASPQALAQLDGVRGYLPPIDLEALALLPEGRFLLGERFEEQWTEPLPALRQRLDLPQPPLPQAAAAGAQAPAMP
jgi:hypothetical protein